MLSLLDLRERSKSRPLKWNNLAIVGAPWAVRPCFCTVVPWKHKDCRELWAPAEAADALKVFTRFLSYSCLQWIAREVHATVWGRHMHAFSCSQSLIFTDLRTVYLWDLSCCVGVYLKLWRDLKIDWEGLIEGLEIDGREEAAMAETHTDPGAWMKIFSRDFIPTKCSRSPQSEIHAGSCSFGSFSNSLSLLFICRLDYWFRCC